MPRIKIFYYSKKTSLPVKKRFFLMRKIGKVINTESNFGVFRKARLRHFLRKIILSKNTTDETHSRKS